jgi:hypothetical protein
MALDLIVPRFAVVTNNRPILSGITTHMGRKVAFFDRRDAVTGQITRELRPVGQHTPHFILPGVGQVDEGEMAEITAKMQEEGAAIAERMRERRGPRPTGKDYQEALHRVLEQRISESKGESTFGPHYRKEAGQ